MATRTSQRVFNTVFPPEESPFLDGVVIAQQLSGEQRRLRDVVTRVLALGFAIRDHGHLDIEDGMALCASSLMLSLADRRATGLARTYKD
jgi:hypothetical protein